MEEQEAAAWTQAAPKQEALAVCEGCKSNPSKYKCPGCSVRSCSLPCVKAHKQRTGCTGKRNQIQCVPLSQFNDNLILSDYNLLEEVKRVTESAQRVRTKLCGYPHFKLPFYLRSLRSAAGSRRTKLLFLPSGMSKREKNQTRYEQRKKFISWTIEWRFHLTDVVLLDHGVHEDTNLLSVIERHLEPGPWNHELRQFCEEQLDCLKLFIRKYPKGPRSSFCKLDIKAPLRQQLTNLVILEYPVIHVFLPSHSCDFEVVQDSYHVTPKPELKDSISNDHPCPKVVHFREEEIEGDSNSSDPKVFDLIKFADSSPVCQIPHQGRRLEKAIDNSSDWPLLPRVAVDNTSHLSSEIMEPGGFEHMFDFDQGLIDSYSDLIAQINPDDFLDFDFEGEFAKEAEENKDFSGFTGVFSAEEELEEGEILE